MRDLNAAAMHVVFAVYDKQLTKCFFLGQKQHNI